MNMENFTLPFFLLYLLLPSIAVITGIAVYFANKKSTIFSTKKLVLTMLFSTLILGLPGLLGLVDYWFMPYIYIILGIIYFFLGIYDLLLINQLYANIKDKSYGYEFLFFVVQMIMGAALFSLIFNLCNELKYGLWACSCILPFLFISLYRQTFRSFMRIPLEVYKLWEYSPDKKNMPILLGANEKIVRIELYKKLEDDKLSWLEAAFREDLLFGEWFQYCIENNNLEHPSRKIDFSDEDNSFGWIFYIKPSFFLPKRYIDPDISIRKNRITRLHTIIARRKKKES